MVVGILSLEILIPGALSLKDKRKIVKSITDRLSHKFNVSVAETGYQDKWQRSALTVALVSQNKAFVEKSLNTIFDFLDKESAFEIIQFNYSYC